jgi:gliding motility-associated-like protein
MKLLILPFFLIIHSAFAQFCPGSLSDPIMAMTFGTSSKPIPGNTTFDYVQGCPNKGEYTIKNLIFGCGNKTWLMMAGDHTLDVNGQYMLVNGESTDEIVYIDTVSGLCANISYQFTAWITNVMQSFSCNGNAVLPNLTFTVEALDKTILETYNTGDIPIIDEKQWKQYGLAFKLSAANNTVILKIKTSSKKGCGAAFAIDDIFLKMCGPLASAAIDGDAGAKNVCTGYDDPFLLTGTYSSGFINPEMQWQQSIDAGKTWTNIIGATAASYSIPKRDSGIILFRFIASEKGNINLPTCRIASNVIYTEVHPVPLHQPPQNIIGCLNKNLLLPKANPSALNVLWSGPNAWSSTLFQPLIMNVQNTAAGIYQVQLNFHYGCTSVDTFYLQVFPGTTITTQASYTICEGETVQLNAQGEGSFEWFPNVSLSNNKISNPISTPKEFIDYKVILTNTYGCKDSAYVAINVYKKPEVFAGPDLKIETGDSIKINLAWAKGTDINIAWSPNAFIDNNQIINPLIYPNDDITYTLKASSNVGCGIASDAVTVKVYKDVFVPTAFTPNGDGLNDVFRIYAAATYKLKKLIISNRWGKQIYTATNPDFTWNGTWKKQAQPQDTYVYYLELEKQNGKKVTKKGTVLLIR